MHHYHQSNSGSEWRNNLQVSTRLKFTNGKAAYWLQHYHNDPIIMPVLLFLLVTALSWWSNHNTSTIVPTGNSIIIMIQSQYQYYCSYWLQYYHDDPITIPVLLFLLVTVLTWCSNHNTSTIVSTGYSIIMMIQSQCQYYCSYWL